MNDYKKASCKCGESSRTFIVLTDEVRKDINTLCSRCGTKLKYTKKKSLWQKIKKIFNLKL